MQTQLKDSEGNPVANTEAAGDGRTPPEESPPESSLTGTSGVSTRAEPPVSTFPGAAVTPAPGSSPPGPKGQEPEGEQKQTKETKDGGEDGVITVATDPGNGKRALGEKLGTEVQQQGTEKTEGTEKAA